MEQLLIQLTINTIVCFAAIGFAEIVWRWKHA